MSGVRRNQKLYSVNTRNKQVYILIEILRNIHNIIFLKMMELVHKTPNTPLRVDSSGTRMIGCMCREEGEGRKGVSWHN